MRLLLRLVLWPWLLAALVVGRLESLARLPLWTVLALIAGLAGLTLAVGCAFRFTRQWLATVDPRRLVAVHGVRLYGVYLLTLLARGDLPAAFAPGAWSEILVGTVALAAALLPLPAGLRRHVLVIWNTAGLMGLLLVGYVTARIGLTQPWQLASCWQLPLSLLPTFIFPLLLATHVLIYARVWPETPETTPPG